ncbi:L-2-hydroxyglutarate oxidase [Marinifilum caeruleilacunae]|uniref:L-2-hydroxyglutarate oxidase n=1 Tax=Marinifilum caeruleilacunae TaxID=2499076 RepID=A0ABX1WX87_9BACT|nr:L-2-hydroxyglutarate oxidase [Marinifilum caeruleilacunae]NOU60745.1 L-2-hydroxyglutarate oxidase [Marinifilum caeruleilacunae]
MSHTYHYDYIIIGAGIIGLSIAKELGEKFPKCSIAILEKEDDVAKHASGLNSGVLHAGFYYTSDSLKARFCVDGNRLMKAFCKENNIPVNHCGKVVIASNEEELQGLYELENRGRRNGVDVELIDLVRLKEIDSNAKSYQKALYSPNTASVDPKLVCTKLKEILVEHGVKFEFSSEFKKKKNNIIYTNQKQYTCEYLINAAGLYADKIARQFGFAKNRIIIPFRGNYLKYSNSNHTIKTHIYPVPNLLNPFLGVHYTLTVKNELKLGPTATPALWRENYKGLSNFNFQEFIQIIYYETKLFLFNSFHFRRLAISEIKKYNRKHFVKLAQHLSNNCNPDLFDTWTKPGIRAQLLNTKTLKLEMDFIVEKDEHSLHILNAVSPAFTCSFAFASYLVSEKIKKIQHKK